MKRVPPLLLALALALGVAPSRAAGPESPGTPAVGEARPLWPRAEKVEKPYTNDKCLEKCHGVPGFGAGAASGILRNLHVDTQRYVFSIHGQKGVECVDCHRDADPNVHPRTGYPDVDCRACHAKEPPEGVYPPDALARLQEKGIKPPPEESRNAEGWMKTKHGKAWQEGNPAAPFCHHCHTAHYAQKTADPTSTMHPDNRAATCGVCHVDQVRAYDVGGFLARFRIGAHGKGDLTDRYDVTECVACHQGEAAHGEESLTGQRCPACHRVPEEEGRVDFASLHIKPLAADQPLARALRWVYRVVFWGAVGLGAVLAVTLGFASLYRRDDDGGNG